MADVLILRLAETLAWVALGTVGLVLAALGRFYQAKAGRSTYYRVLAAGAIVLLVGGVWDAWTGSAADGWAPSVVLAVSGLVVGWSARHLFGLMLEGAN
ncbi:MAG: hypothetical protein GXX93_11370 [Anaerolineae bacterium]|nr:hypothetical protein [Anaerolineae bacterium]